MTTGERIVKHIKEYDAQCKRLLHWMLQAMNESDRSKNAKDIADAHIMTRKDLDQKFHVKLEELVRDYFDEELNKEE